MFSLLAGCRAARRTFLFVAFNLWSIRFAPNRLLILRSSVARPIDRFQSSARHPKVDVCFFSDRSFLNTKHIPAVPSRPGRHTHARTHGALGQKYILKNDGCDGNILAQDDAEVLSRCLGICNNQNRWRQFIIYNRCGWCPSWARTQDSGHGSIRQINHALNRLKQSLNTTECWPGMHSLRSNYISRIILI